MKCCGSEGEPVLTQRCYSRQMDQGNIFVELVFQNPDWGETMVTHWLDSKFRPSPLLGSAWRWGSFRGTADSTQGEIER